MCRCSRWWEWRSRTTSPDRSSEARRVMFGDLSFSHILILLLVLVLVFGAKRIPEIGSSLGKGIKEFQGILKDPAGGNHQPPPAPPPRAMQPPAASSPLSSGGDAKRLSG